MNRIRVITLLLALLPVSFMRAQELTVKSFGLAQSEIISGKDKRNDLTNQPCALLKIQMVDQLEKVEGNVMGNIVDCGTEKWVYITDGTYQLRIHPKNHLPIDFKTTDYGVKGMESNRVYVLRLSDNNLTESSSALKGKLKVFRDSCYVLWDKKWMRLKADFNYLEDSEVLQKKLSSILFKTESTSLESAYQKFFRSFTEIRSFEKYNSSNEGEITLSVWPIPVNSDNIKGFVVRYFKRWTEKKYEKSVIRMEYVLYDCMQDRILNLHDLLVPEIAREIEKEAQKDTSYCHMQIKDDALNIYYSKKGKSTYAVGPVLKTREINYFDNLKALSDYFRQSVKLDWDALQQKKNQEELAMRRITDESKPISLESDASPIRCDFFFDKAKWKLGEGEIKKLKDIADYMKQWPSSLLYITGYDADGDYNSVISMEISEKRVREVKRLLVDYYAISEERISIAWKGSSVQPFAGKEKNRVVIAIGDPSESSTSTQTKVYDRVEEMPQFKGGPQALFEYLSKSIKYPTVAEENGIQGKVFCSFVVETDGSITDVKVEKSVDPSLDKEAKRVIWSMPKWNPGRQDGKPVRVRCSNIPVTFKLQ